MNLKILNSKEVKEIRQLVQQQWDAELPEMVFLMNRENRIYATTRGIENVDLESLRIESIGMYFAELMRTELRLSIEGSQLLGPLAKRNVLELSQDEMLDWMRGKDIPTGADSDVFQILKHKEYFLGSGKIKDGKLLNFVSKVRRIKS